MPAELPMFNQGATATNTGGFNPGQMFNFGSAPGSNQFMPQNPAAVPMPGNTPGIVPQQPPPTIGQTPPQKLTTPHEHSTPGSSSPIAGGGAATIPTMDPGFTSQFYNWLSQQLGTGAKPFDLSAIMSSTGQATAPGTLTAPLNPVDQLLSQFYQTGQGGPMAGVLPMWQSAIAAFNGPQGPAALADAQLRQQFGFAGDVASSPFAQALTQEKEQNILNQNALLTSATQQALPAMAGFGDALQNLDQSSINNLLQEFMRTQPQYNPLMNMIFGGAMSAPGAIGRTTGIGEAAAILGGIGGVASALKPPVP